MGMQNSVCLTEYQGHKELFKMLLSKYVHLCNEGSESITYRIPYTPISDEMKSWLKGLKEELEEQKSPLDDPDLRRIEQLISDVIQDIENHLKTEGQKMETLNLMGCH